MKQAKKKEDFGMNVLFRVIMAALAAAIPVISYFVDYIFIRVDSPLLGLVDSLQQNGGNGSTGIYVSLNSFRTEYWPTLRSFISDGKNLFEGEMAVLKAPAIAVAVCFVLSVLIALAIFVCACATSKKRVQLGLSLGGFLTMIALAVSFGYIARPLTDGTISIGALTDSPLIGLFLSFAAKVGALRLNSAFFIILFIFLAMAAWTGAYMLIGLDDKKKPKKVKVK